MKRKRNEDVSGKFYLLPPDMNGFRACYLGLEETENDQILGWSFPPTNYPEATYMVSGIQIDKLSISALTEIQTDYMEKREGREGIFISGGGYTIILPLDWIIQHKKIWKSIVNNYKIII